MRGKIIFDFDKEDIQAEKGDLAYGGEMLLRRDNAGTRIELYYTSQSELVELCGKLVWLYTQIGSRLSDHIKNMHYTAFQNELRVQMIRASMQIQ